MIKASALALALFGFAGLPQTAQALNPQPLPPGRAMRFMLNPQPLPPGRRFMLNPQPLPPGYRSALNPQPLPPGLRAGLRSGGRFVCWGVQRGDPRLRPPVRVCGWR